MPDSQPPLPERPKLAVDLFAVFAYVLVAGAMVAEVVLLATLS